MNAADWAWFGPWLTQLALLAVALIVVRYAAVAVAWLAAVAVACLPVVFVLWIFLQACG